MRALLLVVAVGCSGPTPTVEGTWLATDLHVHSSVGSNDTDGLGTREALPAAMAAAGLDHIVLTDHSNSAGSMHCDDVEDCINLGPETTEGWPESVWAGSEISPVSGLEGERPPRGHTGCVAPERTGFPGLDHFVDRPLGEVTGGQGIEQCQAAGGWAILNHPFGPTTWVSYDWTSEAFDAMEVYNGGARFDPWDEQAVAAWEERVADGKPVVAVGGSDCHRWGEPAPGTTFDPALGWPITWVRVLDGETFVDGLKAGRVVVAEPGTELTLVASAKKQAGGPGDTLTGPAWLTATATATEPDLRLELRDVNGTEVASTPIDGKTTLAVQVGSGTIYARVWPAETEIALNRGGVALTNPVTVE